MNEMMIDLETMDTVPSAVILSVGAVVWTHEPTDDGYDFTWVPVERFYRKPEIDVQELEGRTRSIATMKWWAEQDQDAFDEAFDPVRQPIEDVWRDLMLLAAGHSVTRFWASPSTFDFPILDDFKRTFGLNDIWGYNQIYDVRSVVLEANVSAKGYVPSRTIEGKAHMPVTDCEWQIDLLTAARNKLGRRMAG